MNYRALPYYNLSSSQIRDILRQYGGEAYFDVADCFDSDAHINKWSKHKPLPRIEVAIHKEDYDNLAEDCDYGFVVNDTKFAIEQLSSIASLAERGELTWSYPIVFSPMRMSDYIGYDPLETNWLKLVAIVVAHNSHYYLSFYLEGYNLQHMQATWRGLSDYLGYGVAFWQGNDFRYYHCGTVAMLEEIGDISLQALGSGTWHCALCLDTSIQSGYWEDLQPSGGGYDVIALPIESAGDLATITIPGTPPQPSELSVSCGAEVTLEVLSDGNIRATITDLLIEFENDTASSVTLFVELYTMTFNSKISQDLTLTVSPNDIGEITDADLGDEWEPWVLPMGQSEPRIDMYYSYLGTTYRMSINININQ